MNGLTPYRIVWNIFAKWIWEIVLYCLGMNFHGVLRRPISPPISNVVFVRLLSVIGSMIGEIDFYRATSFQSFSEFIWRCPSSNPFRRYQRPARMSCSSLSCVSWQMEIISIGEDWLCLALFLLTFPTNVKWELRDPTSLIYRVKITLSSPAWVVWTMESNTAYEYFTYR